MFFSPVCGQDIYEPLSECTLQRPTCDHTRPTCDSMSPQGRLGKFRTYGNTLNWRRQAKACFKSRATAVPN